LLKSVFEKHTAKSGTDNINKLLTDIINESIEKGVMPSALKVSTVIPIQKISKKIKCSEFHQINMLPVPEKLLKFS
jgi:hypothetical protein